MGSLGFYVEVTHRIESRIVARTGRRGLHQLRNLAVDVEISGCDLQQITPRPVHQLSIMTSACELITSIWRSFPDCRNQRWVSEMPEAKLSCLEATVADDTPFMIIACPATPDILPRQRRRLEGGRYNGRERW